MPSFLVWLDNILTHKSKYFMANFVECVCILINASGHEDRSRDGYYISNLKLRCHLSRI